MQMSSANEEIWYTMQAISPLFLKRVPYFYRKLLFYFSTFLQREVQRFTYATHIFRVHWRLLCGIFPGWSVAGPELATKIGTAPDELQERGYDALRVDPYPHLVALAAQHEWELLPVWNRQRLGKSRPDTRAGVASPHSVS